MTELLRINEVRKRFDICANTLVKWRREGYVREVKIGRIVLIDISPLYESEISEKIKEFDLNRRTCFE